MTVRCKDREDILREQAPAALQALARHAQNCAECARELRLWNEISDAAPSLRKEWESLELWPRILRALADSGEAAPQPKILAFPRIWQAAAHEWRAIAAVIVLAALTTLGVRLLLRAPEFPTDDVVTATRKRLLTDQAVKEVEANEANYLHSIDKLAALAESKFQHPTTPLMASYREKLLVLDAAIADCRANIEGNRSNAHLRRELLSMYAEKERTLEDVIREE
jgi:hypothetical protein